MAAKFNDGDKYKPAGVYHNNGNTRKEEQCLQDQSGSLRLTHSPKGRVEQVAMTPEISNKHVTRPTIPNYLEIDNKTITGTSTIIYQKQDNESDKPEDEMDKILRRQSRMRETNKKLSEEYKALRETVDEIKKDNSKRDRKINIQGRDLKNAVQDEKKRSENFGKELKEVTQKIDNNKTAIEDIQARVDVMSNDNKKLSDIITSLDDVKNNQEASRKQFKEQLAAMETRQIEYISEIQKTQLKMQEMIRIIQAMRNARNKDGQYFATNAAGKDDNKDIPEELQSEVKDTFDENITILGQQANERKITKKINSGLQKSTPSISNPHTTSSRPPFRVPKNRELPILPRKNREQ